MPNTPSSRVSVTPGQRLADSVPTPADRRADLTAFFETQGFAHTVAARAFPPDPEPDAGSCIRVCLPSGYVLADSGAPILDVFQRVDNGPLDRFELQTLADDVALEGYPVVVALQELHGDDVIKLDLVAESLLATR